MRANEGVLGKHEQVPWVRLQPVDAYEGESIVLAIAVLKETGKLSELKTMDNALPLHRQLIGQSIEELEIQRSGKIGNIVKEIPSGKIGPGEGGSLKITVPDAQDSILFAREDGSDFANLEIRSNVSVSGHIIQENWIVPSLEPEWQIDNSADFNPPGYFLDPNGIVHLRGRVNAVNGEGLVIFVLDEKYRPEFRELHTAITFRQGVFDFSLGRCDISPEGHVSYMGRSLGNGWISLDGITFRAKRT